MRKRKEIENDGTRKEILLLEVLLDIRDLMSPNKNKKRKVNKNGSSHVLKPN